MKRFFAVQFILFALISSPSFGEKYTYFGWGAGSCADLLKETKENNGLLDFFSNLHVSGWVQGYISAMNVKNRKTIDENVDFDGVILELIKRCEAEPMSEISDELDWIYKNKL